VHVSVNSSPPVIRTVIDIPEAILEEYKRNQHQQHGDNEGNRTVAKVAVGVAAIYAAIAALQWCEMYKANQIAGRANKMTQENVANADRPWVGVYGMGMRNFSIGQQPSIEAAFSNSGKTPALDFVYTINVRTGLSEHPSRTPPFQVLSVPIVAPTAPPSRFPLFPNGTSSSSSTFNVTLDEKMIQEFKADKRWIIVKGRIDYNDRFKGSHQTNFCFFYIAQRDVFEGCTQGNSAN
jgi:hypothetical protein